MDIRKRKRLTSIFILITIVTCGVYLALSNLEDNIVFFYYPSEIEKIRATSAKIRVGGLVEEDSIITLTPNKIRFKLTDDKQSLEIEYSGILPALFRAKQGIVAEGSFGQGIFIATKLLTKHDENYMPPQINDLAK